MGAAKSAVSNSVNYTVNSIKDPLQNFQDDAATAKKLGGQIADNKGAILASQTVGPGGGTVFGSTFDKNGAGAKTFGQQWEDNLNTIRWGALFGTPGIVTASHLDKNGAVNQFRHDASAQIAPKVGLGKYNPDEAAFGQSAAADQMAKDSTAGQASAASRAAVSSPIIFNPATASLAEYAQLDPTQQAEFRARQVTLANQLADQANGIGPSLAQSQLQQGRDANIAAAMALAASQRGLTAGQGLRQVADQTTSANQLAAQEAARLRLTEQLSAREQLNSVLSGARGQDIGIANADAGFRQQANIANANNLTGVSQSNAAGVLSADTETAKNALKQQAQNDEMVRAYMEQGLSLALAKMKAQQDLETLRSQNFNNEQTRIANFMGGAGSAIAAIAASDKRLKKNIKNGDDDVIDFIEQLGSHTYEYKDKKHGKGTYTSPMAQDLEKSKLGKGMVIDTPDGKMVDYARGAGTYLAAAAMLHKRLKKVESSLAKKG